MVGLGRAAMPPLGLGRGRPLLPSFPPGHVESVSFASQPQPALQSQPSHPGRETLKNDSSYSGAFFL